MQTYPYPTPEGIIDLVRKSEYDRLKWELEEQKSSHADDVTELNERLTKQQADMLDTIVGLRAELTRWQSLAGQMAEAFKVFIEEYEDRKCQFGSDYLWQKHEDVDAINRANQALAAYESAATATTGKPGTAQ